MRIGDIRVGRIYVTALGWRLKVLQILGEGDAQTVVYRDASQIRKRKPLREFAEMVKSFIPDPTAGVTALARAPGRGIKTL